MRFVDEDVIKENFFFCKRLPQNKTGEEIFYVASDYFELAAIVGRYTGFVSRIMEKQLDIVVSHCFLHREALVIARTLPADLASVLSAVVSSSALTLS